MNRSYTAELQIKLGHILPSSRSLTFARLVKILINGSIFPKKTRSFVSCDIDLWMNCQRLRVGSLFDENNIPLSLFYAVRSCSDKPWNISTKATLFRVPRSLSVFPSRQNTPVFRAKKKTTCLQILTGLNCDLQQLRGFCQEVSTQCLYKGLRDIQESLANI